jgi:hypothetical protein
MAKILDKTRVYEMQAERNGLLNEVSRIGAIASAERRKLTDAEDAQVLELMKRVQALEEEITRSKTL